MGATDPNNPTIHMIAPKIAVPRLKMLLNMGTHHKRYPKVPVEKLRTVWRRRA